VRASACVTHTIDFLDDATRPKAPRIEGATEAHRRHGRRLAMIHRLHLQQLAQVRRVMEKVEAGEAGSDTLDGALAGLDMRRNYAASAMCAARNAAC
jgi:hypothetical protein